jgi:hypothetical protein
MIHYHGTPIHNIADLAGCHFCVTHGNHRDIERAHKHGQSVMLDNGAYSKHTRGKDTNWDEFYKWCEEWCGALTWAVIPDEIDAGSQMQDALIKEWPADLNKYGAPVWHMNEPIDRLLRLCDEWPKVCFGSTDEYWEVLSPAWRRRADEAFEAIEKRHKKLPWIHMLRGLQLAGTQYPFASADSTNVGRNHHRHECVVSFARAIDAKQTPRKWKEWRVEKVDEADGGSATEISRGQYPVEQNGPNTVDGV